MLIAIKVGVIINVVIILTVRLTDTTLATRMAENLLPPRQLTLVLQIGIQNGRRG